MPFNFSVRQKYNIKGPHAAVPLKQFRVTSQNVTLWQANRMVLEYIAPIDFDEYIEFVPPKNKSKTLNNFKKTLSAFSSARGNGQQEYEEVLSVSNIDTLPKFLKTFQNTIGDTYTGMEFNSIPFGKN